MPYYLLILSLLTIPQSAYAARTFKDLVANFIEVGNNIFELLVAVAFIVFVVAMAKYIYQKGGSGELANMKHNIIAGVLGLFVIVCLWGIINFVGTALNIL